MFNKLLILLIVLMFCTAVYAADKIKIVTTIQDFKNFAEIIGGDKVLVTSLIKGYQDAHHFEIKPSDIMRLSDAEILIINGADLDYWIYPLIEKSRNPKIRKDSKGFIDASQGIRLLDVPSVKIDRSMGDVHRYGNPHYNLSPLAMLVAFRHIAETLCLLHPEDRELFQHNAQVYEKALKARIDTWHAALKNSRGLGIVVYHKSWSYFFNEFNLTPAGFIEPKPGLSPSPANLNDLIRSLNANKRTGIILKELYANQDIANYIAQNTGYKVAEISTYVGGTKDAPDYISMMDDIVETVANPVK